MKTTSLWALWDTPLGALSVREPSDADIAGAAPRLASFYDDPSNAALLGNTVRFSAEDVADLYREAREMGTRLFLLERDCEVVGDADFRNRSGGEAEMAILVGPRALQGKGLGRRFTVMALALGFEALALTRVIVAIKKENLGSLRMFDIVGFSRDDTAAARRYAEEHDEVCMSIGRDTFLRLHADALREVAR